MQVFLVLQALSLSFFFDSSLCSREGSVSRIHHRAPRVLTWAQVSHNNRAQNEKRFNPPTIETQNENKHIKRNIQDYTSPRSSPTRNKNYPSKYDYVNTNLGNNYHTNERTPPNVEGTPKTPSNTFQRRSLDFLYHKFVEPRIHKHIEPRPSLIEELIGTFENHVRKDLEAWNKHPRTQESYRDSSDDLEAHSSNVKHQTDDSPKEQKHISSISEVKPGETEDTFIVTDEEGAKHMITVDEIINSLAGMNDAEVTELLLGNSRPGESNIRRMDNFQFDEQENAPIFNNFAIPKDIHYNRKGSDDNDIILIKSEDGDTRLVTVKDVIYAEQNKQSFVENNQPKMMETNIKNSKNAVDNSLNKNNAHFLNMEDLLKFQNSHIISSPAKAIETAQESPFPIETQSQTKQTHDNDSNSNSTLKENTNEDPLTDIRQSLLDVRQQQQHLTSPFRPSPAPTIAAPNSPPLKIINTEASIMEFLPFRNTVSIINNAPPVIQKTGLRNRLSNFFSRLLGKPTGGRTPVEEDRDEFVQIVMPRSDSNIMQQITIPLPKPIHYRGSRIHKPTQINSRNTNGQKIQRRSSTQITSPFVKKNSDQIKPKMNIGTSTAELILKTAKVPESVRTKILSQMRDKPKFNFPSSKQPTPNNEETPNNEQIDRLFFFNKKNKSKKKDIEFPVGYTYDVPDHYEHVPHGPHYPPTHHGKPHHDEYEEDPPLFDLSLLADLNLLSKFGEDNESFSFPKIGDSSKFVNIRTKH